jgi:hypothetical protein
MNIDKIVNDIDRFDIQNNPDFVIQLINQQWQDIHHSRNQDWIYWVVIGGVLSSLFYICITDKINEEIFTRYQLVSLVGIVGFLFGLWASAISWSHWVLHIKRIGYINWLERLFYLGSKKKDIRITSIMNQEKYALPDPFIVNGLMFSMYFTVAILFFIISIYSGFNISNTLNNKNYDTLIILIFAVLYFLYLYFIVYNCACFKILQVKDEYTDICNQYYHKIKKS